MIAPGALWSTEFPTSPLDGGLYLQAAAPSRATLVQPGRDSANAVQLTTQPGDVNIAGSGTSERCDLESPPSAAYGNQGQEEWWAHSLLLPAGYVVPPAGATWEWGVLFNFHHSLAGGGQPNFQIASLPTGVELWVCGGPVVLNAPSFRAALGPLTKGVWYDCVYHIKWSANSDGVFQAWVNGKQVMDYSGPTLYAGQSAYLKLANYHSPLGVPVSVVHSRIVRGATQADVALPLVVPPPVAQPPAPVVLDLSSRPSSIQIKY
jgi:hypothetical protein